MKQKNAGRALQALKIPKSRICIHCGQAFTSTESKAVYCGVSCRVKAWRKQQQAKQQSESTEVSA